MYVLIFLIGIAIGIILKAIFTPKIPGDVYGQIDVEEESGLCRVRVTGDVADPKLKRAIFKINHNVDISRDKQSL